MRRMVAVPRAASGTVSVTVAKTVAALVTALAMAMISGCAADGERPGVETRTALSPAGSASPLPPTTPPAASSSASSAPPPTPAASPSAVVTGAGCNGTPVLRTGAFLEVPGTAEDAELWGLLFPRKPLPLPPREEVKIVWRMTGEGPLQVQAALPDGTRAKLAWGPEAHGGSNWPRPGEEWGTGFVFPKRGCWKVELTRTRGSGHVWLLVR